MDSQITRVFEGGTAVQEGAGEDGVAALLVVNVELLENPLLILEAPLPVINLLTFTEKLIPRQEESDLLVRARGS